MMRRFTFERLVLWALWHLLWASVPQGAAWHARWKERAVGYLEDETRYLLWQNHTERDKQNEITREGFNK